MISKDTSAYPIKGPSDLIQAHEAVDLHQDMNVLQPLIGNSEAGQNALRQIEIKYGRARKILDYCLLEIVNFVENAADGATTQSLKEQIKELEKERDQLKELNKNLQECLQEEKDSALKPPNKEPVPEIKQAPKDDPTLMDLTPVSKRPSLNKIQPVVYKRNSIRKVQKTNLISF